MSYYTFLTQDPEINDSKEDKKTFCLWKYNWISNFKWQVDVSTKREALSWCQCVCSVLITSTYRFYSGAVSLLLCGRLGVLPLNAVTLANSVMSLTNLTINVGLTSALDTIFSHSFGGSKSAGNVGLVFIYIWLLMLLLAVVIMAIFLNIEPIILALGQNAIVSRMADQYLLFCNPSVLLEFTNSLFMRYYLNHNYYCVPAVVGLGGLTGSFILQYLTLHVFELSYVFSALCKSVVLTVMCLIQYLHLYCAGILVVNNDHLSFFSMMYFWKQFIRIAFPSVAWAYVLNILIETNTFMAGTFGPIYLGGYSLTFHIFYMTFILPSSVLKAVTIRMGQNFGAENYSSARLVYKYGLIVAVCTTMFTSVLMLFMARTLVFIFSNNDSVRSIVQKGIPFAVMFNAIITLYMAPLAAIQACGRYILAANTSFIILLLIGFPSVYILTFSTSLELKGIWIGSSIGLGVTSIIWFIIISKVDWKSLRNVRIDFDWCDDNPDTTLLTNSSPYKSKYILFVVVGVAITIMMLALIVRSVRPSCIPAPGLNATSPAGEFLNNITVPGP